MKARLYDPNLGRFITPDPLVTVPSGSRGVNRYAYAENSPLSYVDPLGLDLIPVDYEDYLEDAQRQIDEAMAEAAAQAADAQAAASSSDWSSYYDVEAQTSAYADGWGWGHADDGMCMAADSADPNAGFQGTLGAGSATPDATAARGAASWQQPQSPSQTDVLGPGAPTASRGGITFAKDPQDRLIVTDEIMQGVMKDTLRNELSIHSRYSGPGTVVKVMRGLDTPFYDMGRQGVCDTFVYGGLEFSPDQLNYVGVGMGSAHFHWLRPVPIPLEVGAWNLLEHGHPPSYGEIFWAWYGKLWYEYVP